MRGAGRRGDRRFVGITCTSIKTAGMRIGEQLPCTRDSEPGTRKDPFAVAVVRSSVSVSQQLTTNDRLYEYVCARRPALLLRAAVAASDWAWLTEFTVRENYFCKIL